MLGNVSVSYLSICLVILSVHGSGFGFLSSRIFPVRRYQSCCSLYSTPGTSTYSQEGYFLLRLVATFV